MRTYLGSTAAGSLLASTLPCAAQTTMPGFGIDVSVMPEWNLDERGNHQWKPFVSPEPPV